ncbi:hypothetical protein V6N11_037654 [Hibiscus sabdariffa]|uniref:Uncharacterized protein n=1 Tax=Hibiscus sabdariffa TaxID=183260 RepID=A0ABR2PCQ0_9ROSI
MEISFFNQASYTPESFLFSSNSFGYPYGLILATWISSSSSLHVHGEVVPYQQGPKPASHCMYTKDMRSREQELIDDTLQTPRAAALLIPPATWSPVSWHLTVVPFPPYAATTSSKLGQTKDHEQ